MPFLSEFTSIETVQSGRITTLRARERDGGLSRLLRLPAEGDEEREVRRHSLVKEYHIHRDLDDPAFFRALQLRENGEGTILVLDDPEGAPEPLDRARLYHTRDYVRFCTVGLKLLTLLERLQAHSILHLNMNPSAVWYSAETDTVHLMNFQFASRLTRIEADPAPFFSPDRQPAYLAPEQTGLVRQSVDLRTDLYSLAATLYFLFTGRAPFEEKDAGILQHRVIASLPDPPARIDPHIPESISTVLMKALSKDPRERYHSVDGMRMDLEEALALIQSGHTEETFQPGRHDLSADFRLPTGLYGREQGLSLMKTLYAQAREGQKNVLLIQGPPGSGKTMLALEMQREVALAGGFFAMGQPAEGMEGRANSFITEALEHVLSRILSLPEKELAAYRISIQRATLGHQDNLINLCPSLEWIFERKSTHTPSPGGAESSRQIIPGLVALFRSLSPRGSPLLLFFDDLHRADPAGLDLLLSLVEEPELDGIFFILAMRTEEARGTAAEFPAMLARRYAYLRTIDLQNLSIESLREYLKDMFQDSRAVTDELSEILFRQTGGNPLYAREMIQTCHERGWIRFDATRRGWAIDLESIRKMELSENVVGLLTARIQDLPEEERHLLEFAAIVGETFDLFTLYWVSGWTPERIVSLLRELYRLDFIRPEEAAGSIFEAADPRETGALLGNRNATFRFTHERIRRAAYDSSDEASRTRLHAYAGIHLLEYANRDPEYLDHNLFRVIGHLNEGRVHLNDRTKRRLLSLDLKAGLHALHAGDPEGALGFFRIGLELANRPDIADSEVFQIQLRAAEVESLTGNTEQAEAIFQFLYEWVIDPEDRLQIYRRHIPLLTIHNRFDEAIKIVLAALEELGFRLPPITDFEIQGARDRLLHAKLFFSDPEDLRNVPELTDTRELGQMELLCLAAIPAFARDRRLFEMVTLESAFLLSRGSSPFAPEILSRLFSVCPADDDVAGKAGRVAKQLIESRYRTANLASNLHWYSILVSPFLEDVPASILNLETSIRTGLSSDNHFFAGRSAIWLCAHSLIMGHGLEKVLGIAEEQLPPLRHMRQEDTVHQLLLWTNGLKALRGESPETGATSAEEIQPEKILSLWDVAGNRTARFMVGTLHVLFHYVQDDLAEAGTELSLAFSFIDGVRGTIFEHAARFLECLILFRDPSIPDRERRLHRNAAEFRLRAFYSPRHFGLWHRISETLLEFIENRRAEAVYHLEEALATAGETGRLIERALIEDLLHDVYRSERKKSQEILYFTEALSSHRAWGCGARLRRLVSASRESANLLLTRMEGWRSILSDPSLDAEASPDAHLLMKASGAIAKEVSLEGVVHTILSVLLRLSGAQRALFFYRRLGQLRLVAEGGADTGVRFDSRGSEVFEAGNAIPHSMLLYSLRTGKPVLEHNAFEEGDYAEDPYIASFRVRSALCMPLLRQGQVQGILYLENRMTGHTFHPARIELLRQLSGQMVASLANADYYESLEAQIRERTQSLKDSLSQVEILKQQQDVDYYLISVLLHPLLENGSNPDRFRVSFLIRQKKRFRFKKWKVEIGGDLCFGARMALGNRNFSVIVNGDAMGKSLQGSGGALVLGSVLKALVERTRLNPAQQNISPEEWLLNSIREIHQVFTTFNGLMFVTCMLGLLEEETNTLHYINAGHPRPVLYRDRSATYSGEHFISLKPGMKFFSATLENIESLQMKVGDVILIGSDGKDDIIISQRNDVAIINEEESFFLRVVEQAEGDTRRIYRQLRRNGTLSDDLTLIRIERPI